MRNENKLPSGSLKLAHGTKCICGTCGSEGTWDSMREFDDAVWHVEDLSEWGIGYTECVECYVRR